MSHTHTSTTPSSSDDIIARVRAEMLAERFPVPVALELIKGMPLINAWLWFALPPTVRSMFCHRFSSFKKHPQFFDEGGFWYAVLVLATPELDEPERHAKYLRRTMSCAKNRRDLLKFMGMTDALFEAQLAGTCADGKKKGMLPDDTPSFTGFELMDIAIAQLAPGEYDVTGVVRGLLSTVDLPENTVKPKAIGAKMRAYAKRFPHMLREVDPRDLTPTSTAMH
ncbi:hypothetical protein [Burkholderia sp. Ax-1724]|uniref:hypothetical protein n=1 Tax=Burkholderia sp. Ax-1724 TaxID=2608336 RepID=UPI0014237A31|nr:hypothetical protein [Burkholderia sp. Ax-1724]NIF54948.1 hypothetical protein [Burkholderia sp. Ax-1724]